MKQSDLKGQAQFKGTVLSYKFWRREKAKGKKEMPVGN